MKDRNWNILIITVGSLLTIFLLIVIPPFEQNPTINPYTLSLITCEGKEMPFNSENSSMAGVVQCNNGTMIKVHYLQVTNGTFIYSGFRVTP